MILKNLWKEYKNTTIVAVLFIVSLFIKLDDCLGITSNSITCLSIIFGFTFSFILGIYTQQNINVFMKKQGSLDGFILDNRTYLLELLFTVMLIFIMSIFTRAYDFDLITISANNFIISLTVFEILKTTDFVKHYFMVYKNTYCDRVRTINNG